MQNIKPKIKCYEDRLAKRNHGISMEFAFAGNFWDVKEIIKKFDEIQINYFNPEDRFKFSPVLNRKAREIVADFKYCYEQVSSNVYRTMGDEDWESLMKLFGENQINELYDCIVPNANLSRLYNVPVDLITNPDLSAGAFRVLLIFMARSKRHPKYGGARVSGWSAQKIGELLGMHRNTARKCIDELLEKQYLTFLPGPSTERRRKYRVNIY